MHRYRIKHQLYILLNGEQRLGSWLRQRAFGLVEYEVCYRMCPLGFPGMSRAKGW